MKGGREYSNSGVPSAETPNMQGHPQGVGLCREAGASTGGGEHHWDLGLCVAVDRRGGEEPRNAKSQGTRDAGQGKPDTTAVSVLRKGAILVWGIFRLGLVEQGKGQGRGRGQGRDELAASSTRRGLPNSVSPQG